VPDSQKAAARASPASFFSPENRASRPPMGFGATAAGNIRDEPDKHRTFAPPRTLRANEGRSTALLPLETNLIHRTARMRVNSILVLYVSRRRFRAKRPRRANSFFITRQRWGGDIGLQDRIMLFFLTLESSLVSQYL
jgi:hypothetical protein